MKILFVFINLGYYHIARINSLYDLTLDIEVLQLTNNSLEHPWGEVGNSLKYPIHTLCNVRSNKKSVLPVVGYSCLEDRLININPDFIFIPGWGFDISSKILKWAKKNKVKCILMSESKFDDKKRYKPLEYYKSFKYISKFSGAIVGGRAHADYLIGLGMKKDDIQIGYDIVDNFYFNEMTQKIRIENKKIVLQGLKIPNNKYFICVTRFLPRKNLEMLVKSYSNYFKKFEKPWDLVVCGTGEEFDNIHNLIKSMNLNSHIHLPGFVSYSDIVFWYANASCLVHPALSEQWGLVVNEACASQLPIICSDKVGACHELVFDGVNGYKFDPRNSIELENRLSEIHLLGEEKLGKMGLNSYKIVSEKCSPNSFKEACIRLIFN